MSVLFRCVDLETSGLTPPDCVIEIGWSDVFWDVEQKVASVLAPKSMLFKPTQPITPENRAVHHLTDAELAEAAVCTEHMLSSIVRAAEAFALVAANAAFEQQWLTPEITGPVRWICTVKAAAKLYEDAESHSNQATRYRLNLDLPPEWSMPPHRAGPDAYVTGCILAKMLESETVNDLVRWTKEPKHLPRCPLGKWKGKPWSEVETSYLQWIMRTDDMDKDTKYAAGAELDRRAA